MSDTTIYLSSYCERGSDPTFWAEPFNAVTNLAFIVFAILAWRKLNRSQIKMTWSAIDLWLLTVTLGIIGIGSGLWHTLAAPWSQTADVIPIYVFINVYIFSLFIRLIGLRWWQALLVWITFQAVNVGFGMVAPPDTLNGSILYVPTYGLLLVAVVWLFKRHHEARHRLSKIVGLFTLSITFRTIDVMICSSLPIGTHFLWHMLNAVVLYQLILLVAVHANALHQNKNTSPAQS